MRRLSTTIVITASLLLAIATIAPGVAAQTGFGEHPVVGPWIVEADDPDSTPSLIIFHPDGSLTFRGDQGAGIGAWEPTGERTADLTFLIPLSDDQGGFGGFARARSSGEVADDGLTFTATSTVEFPTPDGGSTGQLGPTSLTGTRIIVEPMSGSVVPFEGPSASAAATLFGTTWATESGSFVTEWQADGSYVVTTSAGGVAERGQSDTDGDVLIFRAVGGICADKDGQYRVVFDGPDRFTFELVDDACAPRGPVVDGLVHVRSAE